MMINGDIKWIKMKEGFIFFHMFLYFKNILKKTWIF